VILINLLPHREEKRKRRKAAFFAGLGAAALGGLAISAGWYAIVQSLISDQQARNTFLVTEIKKLDEQIKDIATLKAEIESLKARQKAVEDLQLDRNLPVHLLNDLVKQTPEGVYYTTLKQDANGLALNGIAQTQERVSELLRNTGNSSDWFTAPQLIETKATSAGQGRDARRAYDFAIKVTVKRPQAASAPAAAAPAAAQKKV
jgi:type IV pilus assembly protein PilN